MAQEAPAEIPQPQLERIPFIPTGDLNDAADAFARLILGNRDLLRQFKKATYPGIFESYCCQMETPLAYLDGAEETEQLAELVMERLEQDWKERKVKVPDFNDQILISVYLMPALVRTEDPDALDFAEALQACWKARYPKSYFPIGTYEELCQGFEKKMGCFITTAVCQSQGKPDDCYELTQFRRFRDNWLADQPGGQAMIAQYYDIAPGIVNIISLQGDASAVYQRIWESDLKPCLEAIEQGDNQTCCARYQKMVESLSLQYNI